MFIFTLKQAWDMHSMNEVALFFSMMLVNCPALTDGECAGNCEGGTFYFHLDGGGILAHPLRVISRVAEGLC